MLVTIASLLICLASPVAADQRLITANIQPFSPIGPTNGGHQINLPPILPNSTAGTPVRNVLDGQLNGSGAIRADDSLLPANTSPVIPEDLSFDEKLLLIRSMPGRNVSIILDFSLAQDLAANNTSTASQVPQWFNRSWGPDRLKVSKKVEHVRILTLIGEMERVNASIQGSSLGADEKAKLAGSIGNNILWLEEADSEVQATADMASLGDGIARAEGRMTALRAELRANAGLLACEDLNTRIGDAINASEMVSEKLKCTDLSSQDRARYDAELASYDGHIYNASLYASNAREAFLKVNESPDGDARYSEGLAQIELAQDEMGLAYVDLNDIFHHMN